MAVITKQQLEDASLDSVSLGEFVNNLGLVNTRTGASYSTLQKLIADTYTQFQNVTQARLTFVLNQDMINSGEPPLDANGYYPLAEVVGDLESLNGLYYYNGAWLESTYSDKKVKESYENMADFFATSNLLMSDFLNNEDLAYCVVDDEGKSSWLAVSKNGTIPTFAVNIISEAIVETMALLLKPIIGYDYKDCNTDGYSYVIVDDNGNLSDFALDKDGTFSAHTIAAMKAGVELATRSRGISMAGDSITYAYGPNDVTWSKFLSDEIGLPAWNPSVSGEATGDIATRVGALRPGVTLPGNVIPLDTNPVTVTVTPADGWRTLSGTPITDIGEFEGVLKGVPGILKHSGDDGSWSFTRNLASTLVVNTEINELFTTQEGKQHLDDIWIMWGGRNNPVSSQIITDANRIISSITPNKNYIVLSVLNSSAEPSGSSAYNNIIAINNALLAEYGERYFDIRAWLIALGLSSAGVTPTSQDLTDIANDVPPDSLRRDTIHPNVEGCLAISNALKQELINRGLI